MRGLLVFEFIKPYLLEAIASFYKDTLYTKLLLQFVSKLNYDCDERKQQEYYL